MRASDRDRAVIETVLADAFAEGRLTRAEYDERAEAALASRTLGDLVPLVEDLPVVGPAPLRPAATSTSRPSGSGRPTAARPSSG